MMQDTLLVMALSLFQRVLEEGYLDFSSFSMQSKKHSNKEGTNIKNEGMKEHSNAGREQ